MTYKFFKGERKIYTGYTQAKNGDSFPPKFDETSYDIKMKCPRCNKIVKLDEPVIVYGPNTHTESESTSDMMVETPFRLYCERCGFEYVGCVQSGVNDTSFVIQPIEDYWYFWIKEVE